jgi:hypothetical protein
VARQGREKRRKRRRKRREMKGRARGDIAGVR